MIGIIAGAFYKKFEIPEIREKIMQHN